jgi:hypothetical protein
MMVEFDFIFFNVDISVRALFNAFHALYALIFFNLIQERVYVATHLLYAYEKRSEIIDEFAFNLMHDSVL